MMTKKCSSKKFLLIGLLSLLVLLAACGGDADEAVEDTGETDTSAAEEPAESETIDGEGMEATGSEEDSGEIPPTPAPGSKVETARTAPTEPSGAETVAANPTPLTNRGDSGETAVSRPIDLVFLIDATGSMAAELQVLQAGLPTMASELALLPDNVDLRFGLVLYRDQGKTDTVQLFELTEDWSTFATNLESVTPIGGGDYAEELNVGFYQAVTSMNWRAEADKLLILVGDAPPQNANNNTVSYEATLLLTSEQNIILITIGGDGLNEYGNEVFQQMAEASNGRFVRVSDTPERIQNGTTAVYPTSELPIILVEIVQEILNVQAP